MHEGPLTVRPTPGQRCVEWPQTDARAKLWVRRTNTNLTRDRHRPCGLQTNLGPSACSNMQLQHATPTCNGNVSRTTGNSRDYSLLCFWIFCIAIPCTYGVKDPWENQHNLDQLLHAKIFNHHLFLVIVSFGWIYYHAFCYAHVNEKHAFLS